MIVESIITGIVAWVFVVILMEEGMIFAWWWNVIHKLPDWLRKPLGDCEYCFAGQLALWYYLIAYWSTYNPIYHIAFISITNLTVKILNRTIDGN